MRSATSRSRQRFARWPGHPRRWLNFRSGLIGLAIAQLMVILAAGLV